MDKGEFLCIFFQLWEFVARETYEYAHSHGEFINLMTG